ncbi:MAG: hypothetical protein NZM25_10770 [Leptospiraceae bacterium]|nr:hypothetical protein [Leptospiraceae bacterium]MDW8305911.1 hypothetical protein [Leptospiraceae bacterium]
MTLTLRERVFLVIGSILIMIMLGFLLTKKLGKHFRSLEERLAEMESSLQTLEKLGREYVMLQSYRFGGEETSLENMVPQIESILNSLNLRDKITSITPRDVPIENNYVKRLVSITLRDVSALEFLDFIKQVEQSSTALYKIENFSSRPVLKKTGLYNVSITVAGFRKKSEG